jgi:hypothetical protein
MWIEKTEFEKIKGYLDNIISEAVVIYGAGRVAKRFYNLLEYINMTKKIICFAIDDVSSNPQFLFGKNVVDWRSIVKQDEKIIIALGRDTRNDVRRKLASSGISDERLIPLDDRMINLNIVDIIYPFGVYGNEGKMLGLYNKWIYLRNNNVKISSSSYFDKVNSISIYGYGEIGKRLVEELENEGKVIRFIVDSNAYFRYADYDFYTINEDFPKTELMIVTDIGAYESLLQTLNKKTNTMIVSFEDVINSFFDELVESDISE